METYLWGLFGVAIGSFSNVVIDRLPEGESIVFGRSHCDYCRTTLSWYELIPVFSFLIQGGRCRHCRKKLSFQYPIIEMLSGLGYALSYIFASGDVFQAIIGSALWTVVLISGVSDIKYQLLPDSMTVLLAILGIFLHVIERSFPLATILSACIACAFFYFLWRITKGKGMGFGDVKLAFSMGIFLGFPNIIIALYIAFLTGALLGVILLLGGRARFATKIAFGPFLLFGTFISYWWGGVILRIVEGFI